MKNIFCLLIPFLVLLIQKVNTFQKIQYFQRDESDSDPEQCKSIILDLNTKQIQNICVSNDIILQVSLDESQPFKILIVESGQLKSLQMQIQDISQMLKQAAEWSIKGKFIEFEEENKQRFRFLSNEIKNLKLNEEISHRLIMIKVVQLQKFIIFDKITQSVFISNSKFDIFNLISQLQQCKKFTFTQIQNQLLLACDNQIIEHTENLLKQFEYNNDNNLGLYQKLVMLKDNQIYFHNKNKVCNVKAQCFTVEKGFQIKYINKYSLDLFQIQLVIEDNKKMNYFINVPYFIYKLRTFQNDCSICNQQNQNCQSDCFSKNDAKNSNLSGTQQDILEMAIYLIISTLIISLIACSFLINRYKKHHQDLISNILTFKYQNLVNNLPKIELPEINTENSNLKSASSN